LVIYLWNQHSVTGLNGHSDTLSILIETAWADGKNSSLGKLFDTALWEEETGCSLRFGLNALDEDAIEQGRKRLD
jgi:hypothetical protein